MKIKKKINSFLKVLDHLLTFLINLVWIPSFISPPNATPVDFITKDWYILAGTFRDGQYHYYPAKYSEVKGWRPRFQVTVPKLSLSDSNYFNATFLFSPESDKVWEYQDLAGEKHHVTYNTRKLMEDNPMNTTVEDKATRIQEQTQKAKQQNHERVSKIKGNSL